MREEGHELVVYYANSNIWPAAEYEHRLATLEAWAATDGLRVVAGEYDPAAWAEATDAADKAWRAGEAPREERCRACYRQRLEAAAAYAAEHGYEVLATTLAVSPYQHTDIIREEVYRAAEKFGLEPYFEDFRPNYDEATRRSRALGMYRQNYCGCALSEDEAAETRARIKQERTEEKAAARAAYEAEHAEELAAARTERAARAEERRAYDAKQARKHEILRTLRQEAKKDSSQ